MEAGQAFFGIDTDRYGMGSGFLAVGKAGSELRRFPVTRLLRLAAEGSSRDRIASMVATWIEALSRRLVHDLQVPSPDLLVEPGTETALMAGKRLACTAARPARDGDSFSTASPASLQVEACSSLAREPGSNRWR